jgi:hypothetical protein
VLKGARDDVPPLFTLRVTGESENGKVVALGRAARKDDFVTLHPDGVGDLVARSLHCLLRAIPVLVRPAPGVPKFIRQEPEYRVTDGRLQWAGRVAIKVHRHQFSRQEGYRKTILAQNVRFDLHVCLLCFNVQERS